MKKIFRKYPRVTGVVLILFSPVLFPVLYTVSTREIILSSAREYFSDAWNAIRKGVQ